MAVTIEDIISLTKAGFTAQQIAGFMNAPKSEPAVSTPDQGLLVSPVQEPASTPAPAPVQPATVQQAAPTVPDAGSELLEAIKALNGTIQASNITNSRQPEKQSVESILAEIINPPTK